MITLDLTGKTTLVTGGTRGIGQAITRRLAQAGADTLAVYTRDAASAQTSLTERRAFGGYHENFQADIADVAQVDALLTYTKATYSNGLDFLILNAGIGLGGKVTDTSPEQFRRLLDTNLYSAFLLTRGMIPHLRRGGSIVAIGSGAGHDPIPGLTLYGATKAALNMFIADLAQEVGPNGIRANVVSPGNTDTSFQHNAPPPDTPPTTAAHNALRRQGVPDDIATTVLFLCSDLSSFLTGQALRVNGGAL